ncbi:MAG: glycosyltransferase [Anaerolineales bacterium]
MSKTELRPSIIIPTLNAASMLAPLISMLREQSQKPHEIIVVDSSSDDGTADLAQRMACVVDVIPKEVFDHGGTRNRGAQLADGEVLVFLTQDALPVNLDFLQNLLAPIHGGVANAVTARQIPYPQASPLETFDRMTNYPSENNVRHYSDVETIGVMAYFFSNAASAIDRSTFEVVGGFPEDLIVNEDMLFCARLLKAGYCVAYQADALIYHSHTYNFQELFQRFFDIGVFFTQAGDELRGGRLGSRGLRFAIGQLGYLARSGAWRWLPHSVLSSLIKAVAFQIGLRAHHLPTQISENLSRQKTYWHK